MRRETLEHILAERKIRAEKGRHSIPSDQVVTMLIGAERITTVGGIVCLTLQKECLVAESRKGTSTYVEYDLVRGVSFEPKDVADRQAGFV
jgi:hypothetical protein